MRLISWNVQWCRGLDGKVDPARIAAEIRRLADPDVVCLQEVAQNFGELPGSQGEDQQAALLHALPGYEAVAGWAVDVRGDGGKRKRFGNLILSRLEVGRVLRHSLPWPAAPDAPSMPRAAVETVVASALGPVRVMTTHLEYYSREHRAAQIRRLGEIHQDALGVKKPVDDWGPFRSEPAPVGTLLCGDFNLPPNDALHAEVLKIGFVDAWQALHSGRAHPHTFRVHERDAGESPYCCDYVFVSRDLAPRLAAIRVDGDNRASDHQPVIIELR